MGIGAAPDEIPMEVNTAVYSAVNALYNGELIGSQAQVKKYLLKISGANGAAVAARIAKELAAKMASARGSTGIKKKTIGALTKSMTRRNLVDLQTAINQVKHYNPSAFQPALDTIEEALDPNYGIEQ